MYHIRSSHNTANKPRWFIAVRHTGPTGLLTKQTQQMGASVILLSGEITGS